tara:strand:- start:65 stop:991 length:927 start_codon:yes stop_codon:yes gene_type:complete
MLSAQVLMHMKIYPSTPKKLPAKRIALIIQYDGSQYSGWQRQPNNLTIQEVLEDSINKLDRLNDAKTVAAGRTDAGVHASGQVIHFDTNCPMPATRWAPALNGRLPSSIRVIKSMETPKNWHACFSAIYRRYRYTIYNGCHPNLFLEKWSWHKYQYRLDEKLMYKALKGLIGHHDFSAFQRSGSSRNNAFTTIQDFQIERNGDLIQIEIQASGFLYGMVRLIVGQLVALGEHKLKLEIFQDRWQKLKREEIKEAAPAKGLCFIKAGYKDNLFSDAISYANCPKFLLSSNDSPPLPPNFSKKTNNRLNS